MRTGKQSCHSATEEIFVLLVFVANAVAEINSRYPQFTSKAETFPKAPIPILLQTTHNGWLYNPNSFLCIQQKTPQKKFIPSISKGTKSRQLSKPMKLMERNALSYLQELQSQNLFQMKLVSGTSIYRVKIKANGKDGKDNCHHYRIPRLLSNVKHIVHNFTLLYWASRLSIMIALFSDSLEEISFVTISFAKSDFPILFWCAYVKTTSSDT